MKKIFFLTLLISTISSSISLAQVLQEKKVDKSINIQSAEDIINDLKAKKESDKPFDDKDIKIDLESLGLDDVDKKIQIKTNEAISVVKESDLIDKTPTAMQPVKTNSTSAQQDIQKQVSEVLNKINTTTEIKPETTQEKPGVFAKIKKLFKDDSPENHIRNFPAANKVVATSTSTKTKAQRRREFKQRVEKERIAAVQRKKQRIEEEKMIKLNKLRDEFLIKNEEVPQEDEYEEYRIKPVELLPKEKSYNYKERFITYDPPPAPLLDNYRGNENAHIPSIPTAQDKVELLFKIISESSDGNPAAFQSAYEYVLNPNIRNQYGETVLTYASLLQKHAIITSILSKGADPDLPNVLGHTPLDIAIEMLDLKTANILLSMNADINYIDGYGRTYLMHAARVGFFPMVDLFVSHGADINAIDNDGYSALAIAYRHKKDLIVKYLLKNGAEPWTPKNFKAEDPSLINELKNRWKGSNQKF